MNITGLILDALPSGLLPGIVIGAVLAVSIIIPLVSFVKQHFKMTVVFLLSVVAVGVLLFGISTLL